MVRAFGMLWLAREGVRFELRAVATLRGRGWLAPGRWECALSAAAVVAIVLLGR